MTDYIKREAFRNFEISAHSDWDSFMFWKPMNWRDFTVIALNFETGPNRHYLIHFALLGIHIWSQWLKNSHD